MPEVSFCLRLERRPPHLTESATKLKGLKHFDAKFQLVPVGHHSRGSYYDPVPPLTMCSRCKKAAKICISKDFILPLVEANPDLEEVRLAGVNVALPVMRYICVLGGLSENECKYLNERDHKFNSWNCNFFLSYSYMESGPEGIF